MVGLFAHARSIEPELANDFACAGIEDAGIEEDPSPALIAKLRAQLGTPVYPASQCRRAEDSTVAVSGAKGEGTWLTIGDISCSDWHRCTASVSYYVANQGAGGREVDAERTGSGWRVKPTGRMWIS